MDDVNASLSWASSFARSCADKFPGYFDRDDLTSAGILAYVQAATRYKSRLGGSFRGYCATRIRGAVLDEMRRWTWAPRSVLLHRRRLREANRALICRLQREPSRMELASELGVEVMELESLETQTAYRQVLSLNESNPSEPGEDSISLADRIPDVNAASPGANVLFADDCKMMIAAIRTLSKAQGTIIVLHYLKDVPLRDIAAHLTVTPSRVSQLHHQALERMRSFCRPPEKIEFRVHEPALIPGGPSGQPVQRHRPKLPHQR